MSPKQYEVHVLVPITSDRRYRIVVLAEDEQEAWEMVETMSDDQIMLEGEIEHEYNVFADDSRPTYVDDVREADNA